MNRTGFPYSLGANPGGSASSPGERDSTPRAYDMAAAQVAQSPGGFAHEIGELHRLLVESVQDYAIFALDPRGYVLTWNTGARRLKGYEAEDIIGRHFSIFYPPERVAEGFPDYELRVATRVGRFEDEGWRVRKDGTRFWANVVITALFDPDRRLVGFAKVTRDLTERRAAEAKAIADARHVAAQEAARTAAEHRAAELHGLAEQLRRQTAELDARRREAEAANRAKSEFLAAMSHELRTPLNAIGGYAELLELEISGPVTPQQREHIERIRRSQQHLLGIINDILNFSRIEAGQLTYDMADVPMHEVIESVSHMIAPQALSKQLTFEPGACPPHVRAWVDRAKVEQILLNLLSNAVKFTEPGGRITVDCALTDDQVAITVCDTGVGIAADQLERIFEPFVQVGRTLTSMREGTGLGLAISRDLAQAMRGNLTVESTAGEGSAFTLTLPRTRKE